MKIKQKLGIGLTLLGVYSPFFQSILGTVPLPIPWAIVVGFVGLSNIIVVEFGKWIYNKFRA